MARAAPVHVRHLQPTQLELQCAANGAPPALWCHRVPRRRRRHLRRTTDTTKTVWPTFPSIEALVVAVAAVYTESGLLEPHIRTGDKNLFKNRNFEVSLHIILANWRTTYPKSLENSKLALVCCSDELRGWVSSNRSNSESCTATSPYRPLELTENFLVTVGLP